MPAPNAPAHRPVSMRTLFSQTRRESPGDTEVAGHRLLLRAGFVRQLGAGLDRQYRAHIAAYHRIFRRCGLPVVDAGADVGMMGGSGAHEFMYLTPIGEDSILSCEACGYRANRQIARCRKPAPEPPGEPERVHTPGRPRSRS